MDGLVSLQAIKKKVGKKSWKEPQAGFIGDIGMEPLKCQVVFPEIYYNFQYVS